MKKTDEQYPPRQRQKQTTMERNSDKLGAPSVTPAMWEQRRYEIAREIMANCFHEDEMRGVSAEFMALCAVQAADKLIKQLKQLKQP